MPTCQSAWVVAERQARVGVQEGVDVDQWLKHAAEGLGRAMHVYLRGNSLQRLRLASGLVLFAFAATHFLNHSLGLVSFELMHRAQELRTMVT